MIPFFFSVKSSYVFSALLSLCYAQGILRFKVFSLATKIIIFLNKPLSSIKYALKVNHKVFTFSVSKNKEGYTLRGKIPKQLFSRISERTVEVIEKEIIKQLELIYNKKINSYLVLDKEKNTLIIGVFRKSFCFYRCRFWIEKLDEEELQSFVIALNVLMKKAFLFV